MKKALILTLTLAFCFLSASPLIAQDQPTEQPSAEELEKQKAEREKNAYRLLDQVIDEAQSLRLVENRVRIQINAADMLWGQNQGRARSLFASAAEGIAELIRTQPANNNRRNQVMPDGTSFAVFQGGPQNMRTYQLRQELVLTAARHDAALAYQLLAATKPPANTQPTADARGPRPQMNSDESLEQTLLGRIAALDPKLAAQNAEQMMDKGQFPMTIPEVINQLYKQDADAAEKLGDKTVKRIQAANILARTETGGLVQALLRVGPRPASESKDSSGPAAVPGWTPVLGQSAYVDLLSTVVEAALKATPNTQNNQRGSGLVNARRAGPGVAPPAPQPLTDAQMEQINARRLLAGLQQTLPMVDQYLPSKAPLVRQKMSELGLSNVSSMNLAQTFSGLQGNATADALVQAAAAVPQQLQPRLYQQAAYKAL